MASSGAFTATISHVSGSVHAGRVPRGAELRRHDAQIDARIVERRAVAVRGVTDGT